MSASKPHANRRAGTLHGSSITQALHTWRTAHLAHCTLGAHFSEKTLSNPTRTTDAATDEIN
ncbi:hypothetical protein OAO87_03175 [bacterium]|nr:hypothetical protein [bacterium]